MKLGRYFSAFSTLPIRSTFLEKCIAALACLIAIFLTATITQLCAVPNSTILIASMGASAVILYAVPSSPMAQPWPFVGGQMLSALIGMLVTQTVSDTILALTLAIGLSVLVMQLLHCLHPPGAATALAPALSGVAYTSAPDFTFILAPVGINVLSMLVIALIVNRLILRREYPAKIKISAQTRPADKLLSITEADIAQATQGFHQFLDININDLCQILTRLQLLEIQKNVATLYCGDLMQRDIITVEYATEVEDAWQLMYDHHLKVLPVLDKRGHIIGIVTRYDFLKHLKLTPYHSFQDKWLAFIKRSPDIVTNKPEAIGHIMTRHVKTLSASAHIAELVPLVVKEGHHHVPIVDEAGCFVGMVFQSSLLAALFKNQIAMTYS